MQMKTNETFYTITAKHAEKAAVILKTIAHPVRLQIIEYLEKGEKSVKEVGRETGLPQAIISHHLGLMRDRDILNARRNGTSVYYCLSNTIVQEIINCIRTCIVKGEQ